MQVHISQTREALGGGQSNEHRVKMISGDALGVESIEFGEKRLPARLEVQAELGRHRRVREGSEGNLMEGGRTRPSALSKKFISMLRVASTRWFLTTETRSLSSVSNHLLRYQRRRAKMASAETSMSMSNPLGTC